MLKIDATNNFKIVTHRNNGKLLSIETSSLQPIRKQ